MHALLAAHNAHLVAAAALLEGVESRSAPLPRATTRLLTQSCSVLHALRREQDALPLGRRAATRRGEKVPPNIAPHTRKHKQEEDEKAWVL